MLIIFFFQYFFNIWELFQACLPWGERGGWVREGVLKLSRKQWSLHNNDKYITYHQYIFLSNNNIGQKIIKYLQFYFIR